MGAGVGRYQGIHGLILDNLLSVRLVTAAGNIITASSTKNADLFWGFRGAGMNFGVVISATYKISDITNGGQVQDADLIFVAPQNGSYFNTLSSLSGTIPPELSLITSFAYNATLGQVGHWKSQLLHLVPMTDALDIAGDHTKCRLSWANEQIHGTHQAVPGSSTCRSSHSYTPMEQTC